MAQVYHLNRKSSPSRAFERIRMTTFRMRCFVWIGVSSEPIEGFSFVADFTESGVGIYLDKNLAKGEHLRICFEDKHAESYKGRVIWSQRYSLRQSFIAHKSLCYRAGLKLVFGSEAERQRYKKALAEIQAKALKIKPGMAF